MIVSNFKGRDLFQIIKYGISGVTGALIQMGSFYVLVDFFGVWYLYGVVLAFVLSLIITFMLQKFWTFEDYSTNKLKRQSFMYGVIAVCALILNVGFMYLLVDVLDFWHITSQIVVVLTVGTLTFLMNRFLTFAATKTVVADTATELNTPS